MLTTQSMGVLKLLSLFAVSCLALDPRNTTVKASHTLEQKSKHGFDQPTPESKRISLHVKDITNVPVGGVLCDRERGTSVYFSTDEIFKAIKGKKETC